MTAATASLARLRSGTDLAVLSDALAQDGAVIVEGLLSPEVVARVNAEIDEPLEASDPDDVFDPVFKAFIGEHTKTLGSVPAISPAFATDVMCDPTLLGLADAVLGPSCARFQLNVAQILQRGPGSVDQLLHRDEAVWVDVPWPRPELQLASVIALGPLTAANGATRVVPGSHRWPDRARPVWEQTAPTAAQLAVAEMDPGSAVVYTGGVVHGGGANTTDAPRRAVHLSYCLGWLRTEENNYLSIPPSVAAGLPRQAQEVIGYAGYDAIGRGGGYLGMIGSRDPIDLLARGDL